MSWRISVCVGLFTSISFAGGLNTQGRAGVSGPALSWGLSSPGESLSGWWSLWGSYLPSLRPGSGGSGFGLFSCTLSVAGYIGRSKPVKCRKPDTYTRHMTRAVDAWTAAIGMLDPAPTARKISRPDQIALATPATLAEHLWKRYQPRAHTTLIAQAIADAEAAVSPDRDGPRLALDMPPQSGKTETAVIWSAFWWLCKHPTAQLMIVCYGIELAVERGDRIRRLVVEHGSRYGLYLDASTHAKHNWRVTLGGAVRCFGIRTGITGHPGDCLTGETCIITESGRCRLDDFVSGGCPDRVLSFNHQTGQPQWNHVEAWRKIPRRKVITVETESGRIIRCTPDHRIYVEGCGYTEAALLQPGDLVVTAQWEMPAVRQENRSRIQAMLGMLHGTPQSGWLPANPMPAMRHHVQENAGRDSEASASRASEQLLRKAMSRRLSADSQRKKMPNVHGTNAWGAAQEVLFGILPENGAAQKAAFGCPRIDSVSSLPRDFSASDITSGLLRQILLERGPFETNDREGQLAVQGWPELCVMVPEDETAHFGARFWLRGMRQNQCRSAIYQMRETKPENSDVGTSYRPESSEQLAFESRGSMSAVPYVASQGRSDTIKRVDLVCAESVDVYDLQVARNRNFFAGEILVHNCIWIDDPLKSRAEADSTAFRNSVHNSYSGDILSRLAPGGPIFIVATRWDLDDLTGRRTREEGVTAKGGRWRQIHLPAICNDPSSDALGRRIGEPLPHPKVGEGDTEGLLRHWNEKRSGSTPRDWGALYQGDPRPAEGALLTWQLVRERRCYETGTCASPRRIGVAIDPSGGGRDVAGIIGGYLGEDDRLYYTHDRSGVMASDLWAREACTLAAEIDADCFIIEKNYGGDMATLVLRTAWKTLREQNPDRYSVFCPRIITVVSRRGKLLRAEPIAQQTIEDRIRFGQYLPDVEGEWCGWQPDSKESPGRIDACVHLANEMLPMPFSGETQFVDMREFGNVDFLARLQPGKVD